MKFFRLLTMLVVTSSLLLFSSGCVMYYWTGNALRYTKTNVLYDDRDPGIVRKTAELGRAFLVVEVDLTYIGGEDDPIADIRQNLEFILKPPDSQYGFNFYENESWDFYDAIEPIFNQGDSRTGSIFFEIPDVSVYEHTLEIIAFVDCNMCFQSAPVLKKKIGNMQYVSDYPGSW